MVAVIGRGWGNKTKKKNILENIQRENGNITTFSPCPESVIFLIFLAKAINSSNPLFHYMFSFYLLRGITLPLYHQISYFIANSLLVLHKLYVSNFCHYDQERA